MTNKIEPTLKEKAAKGLFWSGINNGLHQILGLLFGLFLARLLTPNDYGLIGMLAIFTSIGNNLQEGGFIAALSNRKHFNHDDYNSVFWFNIFTGISIYIILYFSAPIIAKFYEQPVLINLSRVVFLSIPLGCLGITHTAYLFKNLKVKERTKIDLITLVISNSIAVIMVLRGMGYWSIAIQMIIYMGLGSTLKWYYSPWRPTFSFNFEPLKEMLPFGIKLSLSNIFTHFSLNIFSVLLGKYYSEAEVGYYTQGNKWMTMGRGLISGMINSIAQPIFVQVLDEKERQIQILRKLIRLIAFISFPIMFGMAFIAKELIIITVTEKWLPTVPILQILCLWGAFYPIYDIYRNLVISHGKSNLYLYSTIFFSICQLVILLVCIEMGIIWLTIVYTISYFGWLLLWHYFAKKIINITLLNVLKDIGPYLFITGISVLCGYISIIFVENIYIRFFLKIFIVSFVYIFIICKSNSIIFKESLSFLKGLLNQ